MEVYAGRDLLCVFSDEEMVRNLKPDPERMKRLEGLLLHATAKGREYDCVSRSFAPKLGVTEDPSAAPDTATSYRTGRKSREKTGLSLIRRRSAEERCTAAWKAAV